LLGRVVAESPSQLAAVLAWRRDDPSPNLQAFLEVVREFAPVEVRASDSRLFPDGYASLEAGSLRSRE
jgi:hypothetical protein